MGIASHKPTAQPTVQPSQPAIEPDSYQSIIYSDNNVPLTSLVAYVSGSSWSVTYFKQVVGLHNDLREIDPGQPNIYQQYEQINSMELRVSSPLDGSYDSATGITTVVGNALVYPFMVPNVSDYFTSDAGDSKVGLFRITNVERKTFNRDSAYSIDYEMVGYTDALETLYSDLLSKVIREYHFSKDRLVEGLQPILTSDVYQHINDFKLLYKEMVQYYFQTFFSRHYMTLVMPGQQYAFYDSFLLDYLLKIVSTDEAIELLSVKQLPIDGDPYMSQPQLWSILLNKDLHALPYCNRKMGLVNKRAFNPNGFIHGVYFSNIDYLVYPTAPDVTTQVADQPRVKTLSMEVCQEVTNVYGTVAELLTGQYTTPNGPIPYIHTVTVDDDYVLSANFYDSTANRSVLEILVKDYLQLQTLDRPMLIALCNQYRSWGRLEGFYYIPMLLTLLKEAMRSTY